MMEEGFTTFKQKIMPLGKGFYGENPTPISPLSRARLWRVTRVEPQLSWALTNCHTQVPNWAVFCRADFSHDGYFPDIQIINCSHVAVFEMLYLQMMKPNLWTPGSCTCVNCIIYLQPCKWLGNQDRHLH